MPASVKSIGDQAFKNCITLKDITLPPNLKYFGCENLEHLFKVKDNIIYTLDGKQVSVKEVY